MNKTLNKTKKNIDNINKIEKNKQILELDNDMIQENKTKQILELDNDMIKENKNKQMLEEDKKMKIIFYHMNY